MLSFVDRVGIMLDEDSVASVSIVIEDLFVLVIDDSCLPVLSD